MTKSKTIHSSVSLYGILMYLCAFSAGLVPRYISAFKIHLGIYISVFTILVIFTWVLCDRKIRFYKPIESWFFLVWLVLIVGSVWRAMRIGIWGSYVDWILTAIVFMQLLYHRANEETFETVIRAMVDSLFIQLLLGLYEVISHNYLFEVGTIGTKLYGNVAISTFHNLNDYVAFVVTIMPFAIYRLTKQKSIFGRLYYLFIIFVSVFLVIRSESRSGYLSLVIMGCTLVYLFCKRSKKNRIFFTVLFLLCVLLLIVAPAFRNAISTLFYNMIYDQSGKSDIIRINLIKNGFYFLKQTFGFGVGAGNLHSWLTERSIYPIGQIAYIHNWYVEILATFGILFFLLYMILHVRVIVELVRSFSMEGGFWTKNNTFLISVITFSLASIASSSNMYSEWIWMYLVLVTTYVLSRSGFMSQKHKPYEEITNEG